MKSIIYLFLLLPLLSFSQITYYSTDYLQIGDSYLVSQANLGLLGINFQATGANFQWDFSNLPVERQQVEEYQDPATTGYQFSWCLINGFIFNCPPNFAELTNLAKVELDSINLGGISATNVTRHYKLADSTFQETMLGITSQLGELTVPIPFEFEDKDTILQFPIEFGDVDGSRSRLNLDLTTFNIPFSLSQNRQRTNMVDGWGSLKTPFGTFENTLRMRTVIEIRDTTFINNQTLPIQATNVEYRWFDRDYSIPVLTVIGTITPLGEVFSSVSYIDEVRCISPNPFFIYLPPLPEVDNNNYTTTVEFTNLSTNVDSLVWDFGDGTTSQERNPSHTFDCAGLKTVQLTGYNTVCDPVRENTFTLPILVRDPSLLDTTRVGICPGDSVLIGDIYISEPGIYPIMLTTPNGCDVLEITEVALVNIDPSIRMESNVLIANQEGAQYQWIDCSTGLPINGATNATFAPITGGKYAVEITLNGCVDTSDCIEILLTSVNEIDLQQQIQVYPNPFHDQLTIVPQQIDLPIQISIFDALGKQMGNWKINDATPLNLSFSYPSGLYFLKVSNDLGHSGVIKLVKQ